MRKTIASIALATLPLLFIAQPASASAGGRDCRNYGGDSTKGRAIWLCVAAGTTATYAEGSGSITVGPYATKGVSPHKPKTHIGMILKQEVAGFHAG